MTIENFVEFKETSKVIECQRVRPSALSLIEIFIVILIKVLRSMYDACF